ncbi:MAG: ferrochelatase [Acidimicrobiia bacterium]|nr:ferrochelatase [Acidimicrobiia bacterium]
MLPEALLIVSFGGPGGPEEVMPFLRNVARGRNISDERLAQVAEHYYLFDGISPLNKANRQLVAALSSELAKRGVPIPVYLGNRNAPPMLVDAVAQMSNDGISEAVACVTSAFGSYAGCRQYAEDIAQARKAVGPRASAIHKLPPFWNQEGFLAVMGQHLAAALQQEPDAAVVFTAHSLPQTMAATAPYAAQLYEACSAVAERAHCANWRLAYQSRSGLPQVPWLEPDVCEELERLPATGVEAVILVPIGFVADHMEVVYDLDIEARKRADSLGLRFQRVPTVGVHPTFVAMIAQLAIGSIPSPCPAHCCLYSPKPA